jgi:hypothetical protein
MRRSLGERVLNRSPNRTRCAASFFNAFHKWRQNRSEPSIKGGQAPGTHDSPLTSRPHNSSKFDGTYL